MAKFSYSETEKEMNLLYLVAMLELAKHWLTDLLESTKKKRGQIFRV